MKNNWMINVPKFFGCSKYNNKAGCRHIWGRLRGSLLPRIDVSLPLYTSRINKDIFKRKKKPDLFNNNNNNGKVSAVLGVLCFFPPRTLCSLVFHARQWTVFVFKFAAD